MEKLGVAPFRCNGYGKWYRVSLEEFNFGLRKKRQLSDEQRAAMAERMLAVREASNDDGDDDSEDV